jgi:hypothetical protein
MKKLQPEKNYVFDDVRYVNEKKALEDKGANLIFIIRPYYRIYDNHSSEITLQHYDFDKILINRKLDSFIEAFKIHLSFLEGGGSIRSRGDAFIQRANDVFKDHTITTNQASSIFKISKSTCIKYKKELMLHTGTRKYTGIKRDFLSKPTPETFYIGGLFTSDGSLVKKSKLRDDYSIRYQSKDYELVNFVKIFSGNKADLIETYITLDSGKTGHYWEISIQDPFALENLKLWNIDSNKSEIGRRIPDMILKHENLYSYWLIGLIDGDGCIGFDREYPFIKISSSIEIINFITKKLSNTDIESTIQDHINKNGQILRTIRFFGNNALKFFDAHYNGDIGLERKWGKLKNLTPSTVMI